MNSALSDTDIMQHTILLDPDDKGRVDMQYTLPSGRVLQYGVPHVPNSLKAKEIIAWCNGVRAEDAADRQAEEDRVNRLIAESSSDVPTGQRAPAESSTKESSTTLELDGTDPVQLTYNQIERLEAELGAMIADREDLTQAIQKAEEDLLKWGTIAKGLGIEE